MDDTQDFIFTEKAAHFASSVATMTLYQVLLGRDPENSHVIEENKTQRIEALFRSFVRSGEFADFVVGPLRRGARLRHELTSPAPNPVQRDWLASLLVLPPSQHAAISSANSWRAFFHALLRGSADDAEAASIGDQATASPMGPSTALPAVAPALIDIALGEIATMELRLSRLKDLLRQIGEQSTH